MKCGGFVNSSLSRFKYQYSPLPTVTFLIFLCFDNFLANQCPLGHIFLSSHHFPRGQCTNASKKNYLLLAPVSEKVKLNSSHHIRLQSWKNLRITAKISRTPPRSYESNCI